MERTLNLHAQIRLTVSQLTDLAKQLPKKERLKLASILVKEDDVFITKAELLEKIKEGLSEAKLYKEGKIELQSAREFLNGL
jgi:hypothetical protein